VVPHVSGDNLETATYAPVCLDMSPTGSFVSLVPPITGLTDEDATITQQEWILDSIGQGRWKPIDEQLGMTVDEFTEFALQPNPCLATGFASAPF
jgi:hypothetical protein